MGMLEDLPIMLKLEVLGWAIIVGIALACTVLTEVAYRQARRSGGNPPRDRWHIGQIAFWRYVRQHGRRSRNRRLQALTVLHHVIAAAGILLMALLIVLGVYEVIWAW